MLEVTQSHTYRENLNDVTLEAERYKISQVRSYYQESNDYDSYRERKKIQASRIKISINPKNKS